MINLSVKMPVFWRNVGKLVSGTIVGQISAFIAIPIIARIYSPSDIGALSVINSLAGMVVIIGSLRLERALVLAKKQDRIRLFYLCFLLLLGITLITSLIIYIQKESFSAFFSLPSITLIYVLPFIIVLRGLYNILTNLSNAFLLYKSISISIIAIAIIGYSLKILFGNYYSPDFYLLITSELLAIFFSILILLLYLIKYEANFFTEFPSISFFRKTIKEENDFLKYDNLTSIINNLSWLMPVFFLSRYFDNEVVGYYSLGFTLVRMPMNLLGKSIGNVFYKSSSLKKNTDQIATESLDVVKNLFFFGVMPTVIILFYGKELFTFFLGEKWSQAGVFSQILSLWTLVWLISSPISNLYYTLKLQKSFLTFMIISFILRASAFVVGGELNDVYLTLILFCLVSLLVYGYQIQYLLSKVGVSYKNLIKTNLSEIRPLLLPIFLIVLLSFWDISIFIKIIIISAIIIATFSVKILKIRSKNFI